MLLCVSISVSATLPSIASTSASSSYMRVKLHKLELNTFDPNVSSWQTFWDRFSSSVHDQASINNVDKFSYLKGLLCDSANDCISGLTLSSANYKEDIF